MFGRASRHRETRAKRERFARCMVATRDRKADEMRRHTWIGWAASMAISLATVAACSATPTAPDSPTDGRALYTEILGQSQTQQWFPQLTLPNWQARIQTGSGYMHWLDPNHRIWTNPVTPGVTPPVPMNQIERVVLTIGQAPEDVDVAGTYESLVARCITTIRAKYPAVRQILLQPLAAGPNRRTCTFDNAIVLTTKNLPAIETAITKLVGGDVAAGFVPLVDDCSEFRDATGHLTTERGVIDVAAKNHSYYARN